MRSGGLVAAVAASGLVFGTVPAVGLDAGGAGYDWTGAYAGFYAGYGWNGSTARAAGVPAATFTSAVPQSFDLSGDGALGGGLLGYNRQIDRIILGIEADLGTGSLSGSTRRTGVTAGGTPYSFTQSQHIDPFGSLAARLGVTPIDRLMLFGTVGAAYGYVAPSSSLNFPRVTYAATDSIPKVGWVAGAGMEYAILSALSLKLEYLRYDLGSTSVVGLPAPVNPPFQTQTRVGLASDIIKVGLSYHFGAENGADADPIAALREAVQGVQADLGMRYWYSSGRTSYALGTDLPGLVSRLTYDGLTAHSGEMFFRIDHPTRAFLKGYVGLGGMTGGNLKDEDFPPGTNPYSATNSHQKDGQITYYDVDVGYDLLAGDGYRFGPLVGYHYYHEVRNAYGCNQIATNPGVCVPAIPSATLGITNDDQWHSVRLGFAGDVMLTDALRLSGDAAWLPFSYLDGRDTHWLRLNTPGGFLGAVPQTGTGHDGLQLEAVLSYPVAPGVRLGIGGRFWHDEATGFTHQENQIVFGQGRPVPTSFTTDRYGGFLQAAMHF